MNQNVDTLHLLTDGPTSQYKNKTSHFLATKIPLELGYRSVIWNYLESGHGKGAADGVGAAIKRSADRLIAQGNDIPNAELLFDMLSESETKIKLFWVSENDIDQVKKRVPDNLKAFPGTMEVHQLWTVANNTVMLRKLSCYCSVGLESMCSCQSPTMWTLSQSTSPAPVQPSTSEAQHEEVAQNEETALSLTSPGPPPREEITEAAVGQWCAVQYNTKLYPGIITDVDDTDIEVKCMKRAGDNKWLWPDKDDRIYYNKETDFLCFIAEVVPVNNETRGKRSRHMKIPNETWDQLVHDGRLHTSCS